MSTSSRLQVYGVRCALITDFLEVGDQLARLRHSQQSVSAEQHELRCRSLAFCGRPSQHHRTSLAAQVCQLSRPPTPACVVALLLRHVDRPITCSSCRLLLLSLVLVPCDRQSTSPSTRTTPCHRLGKSRAGIAIVEVCLPLTHI